MACRVSLVVGALVVLGACCLAAAESFNGNYCQADPYVPSIAEFPSDLSLVFVQVITRHGGRAPTDTPVMESPDNISWSCRIDQLGIPTLDDVDQQLPSPDRLYRLSFLPNRQMLPGNCMFGQLLGYGAAQHELLGSNFRAAYVLGHKFVSSVSELWVRSTNLQRTINSVQFNLLGMFPVKKGSSSSSSASSTDQIVNIHTIDDDTDNMTPNTQLCPRLSAVYAQQEQTAQWQAFLKNQTATQQQIAALGYYGGQPSSVSVESFCDMSWCRLCTGFGLSPGVTTELYETAVQEQTEAKNNLFWGGPVSLPWGIGSFVGELRDNIRAFVSSGESGVPARFMFFSGHDSTVSPLTNALFQTNELAWPPYASHVELELWQSKSNQTFFVKTSYNGRNFVVPGCPAVFCPVDTWISSVSWAVPENFAAQCQQSPPPLSGSSGSFGQPLLKFKTPSRYS